MFKFSAVSQIWKKYIQKLNDWDLPLKELSRLEKKYASKSAPKSKRSYYLFLFLLLSTFIPICSV